MRSTVEPFLKNTLGHAARRRRSVQRSGRRARLAGGRGHSGNHDSADDHHRLARDLARRAQHPARRHAGSGRDALGDHSARRPAVRPGRHRRRDHPRTGPSAGRDDGGDDGHRQQLDPAFSRRCSPPATRWPARSPTSSPKPTRRFTSAPIVEIALVLLLVAGVMNALARLLVWSVARGPLGRRGASRLSRWQRSSARRRVSRIHPHARAGDRAGARSSTTWRPR